MILGSATPSWEISAQELQNSPTSEHYPSILFFPWPAPIPSSSAHISLSKSLHTFDQLMKRLLYIFPGQRRGLHINNRLLHPLQKFRNRWFTDSPVLQVQFVANEEDNGVDLGVLLGLLNPSTDVLESVGIGQVEHHQSTHRTFVVGFSDSSEPLLPCRVPNLASNILLAYFYCLSRKLNPHCGFLVQQEVVVDELRHQVGLADPWIPNYHYLEQIVIIRKHSYYYRGKPALWTSEKTQNGWKNIILLRQ